MNAITSLLAKNLHFLVLMWGGYNFYQVYNLKMDELSDIKNQRASAIERIAKLEQKIKETRNYQENLSNIKKVVEDIRKQIKTLQKQLPNKIADTAVLAEFKRKAEEVRLRKPKLSPGKEEAKDFYFAKSFEVAGVGTYLQFLLFFEGLMKTERIYNVKKLVMKRSGNSSRRGRFQMVSMDSTLEAFRYNQDYEDKLLNPVDKEQEKKKK